MLEKNIYLFFIALALFPFWLSNDIYDVCVIHIC
jgi:hypothetical protein